MIYIKHYETKEPILLSENTEEFISRCRQEYTQMSSSFQTLDEVKINEKESVVGVLLQSWYNGTIIMGTAAALVYKNN